MTHPVPTSSAGAAAALARQYGPYLQADWGYANHWYPGLFSREVSPGGVVGITIGGHDIAVTRDQSGKAWAISDRCVHRGVKMSRKPMCFADKTVTCWYHGFTYNAETGNLDTIVGSPDDKLINNARVRTYPTEEFAGIVWVFVGDEDYSPVPPIVTDLPMKVTDRENPAPHLQDPDIVTDGIRREVYGNWRLAAENGLDPGHILVHRDNQMVVALDYALPLGLKVLTEDAAQLIDIEGGPKGIMERFDLQEAFEPVFFNPKLGVKARGTRYDPFFRVSAWLPSGLMVESWPEPGYVQYEFYVPVDDHHHMYWEIVGGRATTEEEKQEFQFKFDNFFKPLGLLDFNDRDIMAREATEEFYAKRDGWRGEALCDMDFPIVAWRKQAAKFGRGFFESPNADEG
jgi:phenylpropionate dioxygenase-like ring-hydroxylating dioxygenase large terminal subunit